MKHTFAVVAIAAALTGCSVAETLPAETVTATATVTAPAETVAGPTVTVTATPEPVAPAAEDTAMDYDLDSDSPLVALMLETSWNEQTAAYQVDICNGWESASQDERIFMVSSYVEGFAQGNPGGLIDPPTAVQVESFFNEKCL